MNNSATLQHTIGHNHCRVAHTLDRKISISGTSQEIDVAVGVHRARRIG